MRKVPAQGQSWTSGLGSRLCVFHLANRDSPACSGLGPTVHPPSRRCHPITHTRQGCNMGLFGRNFSVPPPVGAPGVGLFSGRELPLSVQNWVTGATVSGRNGNIVWAPRDSWKRCFTLTPLTRAGPSTHLVRFAALPAAKNFRCTLAG